MLTRSIDMSRLEALRKIYFWRAQREADAHEKRGGIAFAADREDIESLKYFYYVRAKGLPPRS
jgi:hypothetical protein